MEHAVQAHDVPAFVRQDPRCLYQLIRNLDLIRHFRSNHWTMVRRYILVQSQDGRSTGGTPITTWLPNNLLAVIQNIEDALALVDRSSLPADVDTAELDRITVAVATQRSDLTRDSRAAEEPRHGRRPELPDLRSDLGSPLRRLRGVILAK